MPRKTSVEALFREHLGKEAADAILAKVDQMAKKKATPGQIQKAVIGDISAEIEKQIVGTLATKIGPTASIRTNIIKSEVRNVTGRIKIGPRISPSIEVKVGPPVMTKGRR